MDSHSLLDEAIACYEGGQSDRAAELCEHLLKMKPGHADASHILGMVKHQRGDHEAASRLLRAALRKQPQNPGLLVNLALVCRALNQPAEALQYLQRAQGFGGDPFLVLGNMGVTYQEMGRLGEARQCFERLLQLDPQSIGGLVNLGLIFQEEGEREKARGCFLQVLRLDPHNAAAHFNLANLLKDSGHLQDALPHYEHALALAPDRPESYLDFADCLFRLRFDKDAVRMCEEAIKRRPEWADAWDDLARFLSRLDRLSDAFAAARRALELEPNYWCARNTLASLQMSTGQSEAALPTFMRLTEEHPDRPELWRNLLNCVFYVHGGTSEQVWAQHERYRVLHVARNASAPQFAALDRSPERIKIAYLSSDFGRHPVAFNMLPVFESRDRDKFEVFAYSVREAEDEISERVRAVVDQWRPVAGLDDEQIAKAILDDGVHVLVILAGHFDRNRPVVASYRAAPVQISFHDVATSDVPGMDYLISDITMSPKKTSERYSERILHLPTYYVHAPIPGAPRVTPLPALQAGMVTFGSFNNPSKVTEPMLALWSRVLAAVPNSRLMLKYKGMYSDPAVYEHVVTSFARHGVQRDRLVLGGANEEREQHLAMYEQVDIALDTFPFTGSTTTFEALWMGVPVVTLAGETMLSRWSASMLRRIGCSELIAVTPDEYLATAVRLATHLRELSEMRQALRDRLTRSPLCDESRRARQLERFYQWTWRKWLAKA